MFLCAASYVLPVYVWMPSVRVNLSRGLTSETKFAKLGTNVNSGFVLLTVKWSLPREVQILEMPTVWARLYTAVCNVCPDGFLFVALKRRGKL